jgi:hypothetical protein
MSKLANRIGGYMSVVARLEKKAILLKAEGCFERAEECQLEAAEYRALIKQLRLQVARNG